MAANYVLLLLCCVTVITLAASSDRDLLKRQKEGSDKYYKYVAEHEDSVLKAILGNEQEVYDAVTEVLEHFEGFTQNIQVFGQQWVDIANDFSIDIMKAYMQIYEEVPADVLKESILKFIHFFISVLKKIGPILKEYDPLHPHDSDLRSLTRRKLTTISTFGDSVGFLIGAVDHLAVKYINGFIKDMEKQETALRKVVAKLEKTPAAVVKMMVSQGTQAWAVRAAREAKRAEDDPVPL